MSGTRRKRVRAAGTSIARAQRSSRQSAGAAWVVLALALCLLLARTLRVVHWATPHRGAAGHVLP